VLPGIWQDRASKKSIVAYINENIRSVDAVLILADSTVTTGGMDYVLHTLSTILPKPLANNIGLVFTNVRPPSIRDLAQHTVPDAFKSAPQFVLDNLNNSQLPFTGKVSERQAGRFKYASGALQLVGRPRATIDNGNDSPP
jgi:hypothetical protein